MNKQERYTAVELLKERLKEYHINGQILEPLPEGHSWLIGEPPGGNSHFADNPTIDWWNHDGSLASVAYWSEGTVTAYLAHNGKRLIKEEFNQGSAPDFIELLCLPYLEDEE